jgi:hypothetical protein
MNLAGENAVTPEVATSDAVTPEVVPSATPIRRVVVVSLNYVAARQAIRYANALVEVGVDVDFVVTQNTSATEAPVEVDPRVNVHPVMAVEAKHPIRRVERFLVFRLPGGLLSRARAITSRGGMTRGVDRALEAVQRAHQYAAGSFHHRMFMPVFRQVRPLLLARAARKGMAALDIGSVERIVAADNAAVPLAWRLARRYPTPVATTALDLTPYRKPDESAAS